MIRLPGGVGPSCQNKAPLLLVQPHAAAMEAPAAAAADIDLNFPICISSDDEEEDGGPIYISSDDEDGGRAAAEVIEIQDDPIIPLPSRAPITAHSASAAGSSAPPAAADRKGKRKLSSSQGEPSTPASSYRDDEFFCAICMETVPGALKFVVAPCRHAFCLSCTAQYIAAKVGERVVHVRCPDPGCRAGAVELEDCRGRIPADLLGRWDLALCESAAAPGETKVYCPFRDCSAPLLAGEGMTGEGSIAEADCPHCRRLFCARCMVPWHDGVGCEEFQQLGEHERGREDVMLRRLAGAKRWQRCPQCRMYVERSQGCPFMRCRCGCCFCYTCGSLMCKERHYCKRCNR